MLSTNKILSNYGCYTFNDDVMKERLSEEIYEEFKSSIENGKTMSKECASVIADTMLEWAIELGATHFTLAGKELWVYHVGTNYSPEFKVFNKTDNAFVGFLVIK